MADPLVQVDRRDDGVAVVRIDNPKANALSREVLRQLLAAVSAMHDDLPGAVVFTGGDRLFSAGAEISEFGGPAEAATYGGEFRQTFDAVAALPRATIAAISGYALGGGCELALACDFRLASDRAKLGQPEVLLGITPGGGGTQRLPRLIGPARAKQLIFTGRHVPADEALAIGLVDEVVPGDDLMDRALAFAAELAAGAVAAQGLAKRAIDAGLDTTVDDGQQLEQDAFVDAFKTDDARIGVDSFLADGPGKARFTGR
jgi:enoyl-CoA hydratase